MPLKRNSAMKLLTVASAASAAWLATVILTPASATQTAPASKKPAATKAAAPKSAPVANGDIVAGKKVYDAQGCAGCHAIAGKGGSAGPDLTQTGASANHTPQWFADQVTDPKKHTPDSTMPAFASSIKGKDLLAISAYLASLKPASTAPIPVIVHKGPPPNPALVAKVESTGASVRPIAESDNRLDVSYQMAAARLTDASLAPLAGLKTVAILNLQKTPITDAGLAHIKGLTGLTELHLENTKVTDAGLVNLAGMRELVYLNLYGDNITDAGLEHLTGLTSLKHLYLWQTKVTDDGVSKLQKALPKVEIIRGVDAAPKK